MDALIIKIAKNLVEVQRLRKELDDKEYWIQKAAQETDFVPAEGDWIHVSIDLFVIEVGVHHGPQIYGGTKYWRNGHWFNNRLDFNCPLPEEMLWEIYSIKV